jgi:hypothetical protein
LNVKTVPGGGPSVKSSHALARLYIGKGGTQKPAALSQQTAVVFSRLSPLDIEQTYDIPFLDITF